MVEAHGSHLTLGLDIDTADYFARALAAQTGALLAPMLAYGFADAMREYPGTVGVTAETLALVMRDIAELFCFHGFLKQIYLSGHGASKLDCELGFHMVWRRYPDFKPTYWNCWTEVGLTSIHHADKGETEIALAVGSPVYMERAQLDLQETVAPGQLAFRLSTRIRRRQRCTQHGGPSRRRAHGRTVRGGAGGEGQVAIADQG